MRFLTHQMKVSLTKQHGAALILMVFTLAIVMMSYVFKEMNTDTLRNQQDVKNLKILSEAKAALIAWSVNYPDQPGFMPYPDRNGDNNYDGQSDCFASNVTLDNSFLIGQLPIYPSTDTNCKTAARAGLGIDSKTINRNSDGSISSYDQEKSLWYGVSKNLVFNYNTSTNPTGSYPLINPNIISNPAYPWLKVVDKQGNVISDRVAAVIMIPGEPLGSQDRSAGIENPNQYLDGVRLANGTFFKNYGYPADDTSFNTQSYIIGANSRDISSTDTTYQTPYYFNDLLVYITIDELINQIEKRVAGEARSGLRKFYTSNGYYPYAAGLGSSSNVNQCVTGNLQGLLPTATPLDYSCSCVVTTGPTTRICTCGFGAASTVAFTKTTGSFGTTGTRVATGACSVGGASNRTCTCKGAGTCKNNNAAATTQLTCTACGVCTATVNGTFAYTTAGSFTNLSGCTLSGSTVSCSVATAGTKSFAISSCNVAQQLSSPSYLPSWFTSNSWQNYVYYAVSRDCVSGSGTCLSPTYPLTVGIQTNVKGILITSGAPITSSPYAVSKSATQSNRPSCDVTDYLDSTTSVNGAYNRNVSSNPINLTASKSLLGNGDWHTTYEENNMQLTSKYNDQIFIVAP